MKNERLLRAFGQIDERYILEAAPKTHHSEMENQNMKTNKIVNFLRRPAAMAASLALFLCVSATAVLGSTGVLQGFFGDIFGANGAVVGTSYSQATDEVALTVTNGIDEMTVELEVVYPGQVPYREMELLGIGDYAIADLKGNVILEGTAAKMAPVVNGKAFVDIAIGDLPEGDYKLIVSGLTGSKKADQPLVLKGSWECEFTK